MSGFVVESAHDTPLCVFRIAAPGGAAGDPVGREGLRRHAAELSRRGAGARGRSELDEELDRLGASVDAGAGRDAANVIGLCLSRTLDEAVELARDVLARPRMEEGEHEKLLRETRHELDELRDDDADLATRFFRRHVVPGHPYARTAIGTEASLAELTARETREVHRRSTVADNLLVGFAGDITHERAETLRGRLLAGLRESPPPALPDVGRVEPPRGRRLYLIDKPGRTQSQILIGHAAPDQSSDDFARLLPVETAFGGMFSSRLMQKIRVERGWSYGAGCRIGRARGPMWLQIHLAPSAEVTPEALSLTLELYEELAAHGITAEELELARSYLTGSLAFDLATPRQRLRVAMESLIAGLPRDHVHTLARRLYTVTLEETREAIDRWLRPDDVCVVVVATAEQMLPRLEASGFREIEVLPYDAY